MSGVRRRARHRPVSRQSLRDGLFFATVAALILACLLGGGSSRPDILSLLYLRPVVIAAIGAILYLRGAEIRWRVVRAPLILLGLMALLMIVQLVPLPPGLWARLPGHTELYKQLQGVGLAQIWRPLSLAPEYTCNSLLSLLIPTAMILAVAGLRPSEYAWAPFVLAGIGILSALLGTVQLTMGVGYVYQYSDNTLPIGLFTNRNHQASFLAICLPALRICSLRLRKDPKQQIFQSILCAGIGLYFILTLIMTGSRSGLLVGTVGLIAAAAIGWHRRDGEAASVGRKHATGRKRHRHIRVAVITGFAIAVIGLGGLAYLSGRGTALVRLQQVDTIANDQRITYAPITWQLTRDYFPTGIGFGAFDRVYRMNEPDWALHQSYFNHAHNDLVELAMTGGAPALLLLVTFLLWVAYATITIRRTGQNVSHDMIRGAQFAIAAIIILLLGSLADYPLRTPILAMVMGFAGALLAIGADAARQSRKPTYPSNDSLPCR
ncbi:O-antigen ligase family protein [Sphingomonas parapaucimobilis]|uniref:O-antigen ligase family protein n=1 Tax=Sphingomonas parapaucimobilis TaxID=28213 RepID=UPI00321C236B